MNKIASNVTLEEAEEIIFEQEANWEQSMFKVNGGGRIFMDDAYIHIPSLGINIHAADFCTYDKEMKEWELSFGFYMFLKPNLKYRKVLYDEYGSGMAACISNYVQTMEMEDIYKLKCDVYV